MYFWNFVEKFLCDSRASVGKFRPDGVCVVDTHTTEWGQPPPFGPRIRTLGNILDITGLPRTTKHSRTASKHVGYLQGVL